MPVYIQAARPPARLATALQSLGETAQAEPLFVKCVDRFKKELGDRHPSTLSAMHNLAGCLNKRGEVGEAETIYRAVLQGFRESPDLGELHPQTQARHKPASPNGGGL